MEPNDKQMDNRPWYERMEVDQSKLAGHKPVKSSEKNDHEHDWNDGKHNTTCATCGAERPNDGSDEYHSDKEQDR